jgi:hypothetical protein
MLVYAIICNETGEQYIGSTTTSLIQRLSVHKAPSQNRECKSRQIIDRNNYYVKVLEDKFDSREEMLWRERFYIETEECVNKGLPISTKEEINAKKALRDKTDKARQEHKNYYTAHAEDIKQKSREWYLSNKERVKEYRKTRITCECGKDYGIGDKKKHTNTLKHKCWVSLNSVD